MDDEQVDSAMEQGMLPGAVVDAPGLSARRRGSRVRPDPSGETDPMAMNQEEPASRPLASNAFNLQDPPGIERAPAKISRLLDGRMSDFGDGQSSLAGEDEDISREQLQMIKARTMFQMIEEIAEDGSGGRKRLLFLTNSQAELLASSSASLQKMLDALEIPRPKLVINLLTSQGFTAYCTLSFYDDGMKEEAGVVENRGAFMSLEEECKAIDKLDHFMSSIILPLAAQTQAIIICNAIPSNCVLTSSLTRMLSVHRVR
jgi:hypothetical protein